MASSRRVQQNTKVPEYHPLGFLQKNRDSDGPATGFQHGEQRLAGVWDGAVFLAQRLQRCSSGVMACKWMEDSDHIKLEP